MVKMDAFRPLDRGRQSALENIAGRLVGQSIREVRYQNYLEGPLWPGGHASGPVDEANQGVALELGDGGWALIFWASDRYLESLDVRLEPTLMPGLEEARFESDATSLSRWKDCIGLPIGMIRTSWQTCEGDVDCLWAIGFDFTGHAEVTIALGEVRRGSPAYDPHGVLVIHEPEIARQYRPTAALDDAFGEPIELPKR